MSKKLTTEDFIRRAKQVHGDRYNYSKSVYIGDKYKVEIICSEHGSFFQLPSNHYAGKGCLACSGRKQLNTEEFIKKSRLIHGDKFDYSKSKYINCKTKLIVICPEHGEFLQTPSDHYNGGCAQCSGNLLYTTNEFIEKAKLVHGNVYNYSITNYTGGNNKVNIICPKHGIFKQTAKEHLTGRKCKKCSRENAKELMSDTKDQFIKKAKRIHGNRYSYNNVVYINNRTNVAINCKKHGDFEQWPANHLMGKGCPMCKATIGENRIRKTLRLFGISFKEQVRLGCRDKRKLVYDFVLFKDKTVIEYHGIQHYKPVDFFGGLKQFRIQKFRDILKKKWAVDNGYKFVSLSYKELNNIESNLLTKLDINPQLKLW